MNIAFLYCDSRSAAQHIYDTERGWLNVDDLTDAIDKYSACHNINNRPQAFAIGQNVTRAV